MATEWWLVSLMVMGLVGWVGGYCYGWLMGVKETERRWSDAVGRTGQGANGAVVLSAEDSRTLAFLLARAIREDTEASDGDRFEARRVLTILGGDTQ